MVTNNSKVYILNGYHAYEEDATRSPKHFIHKGVFPDDIVNCFPNVK